MGSPTLTYWLLFAHSLPVLACEAEDAFPASADRTLGEDHPSEIAFPRTSMMLDGQLQWNHPTSTALGWSEEVVIIWVAVSGNSFSSICFQVCEKSPVFHHLPSSICDHDHMSQIRRLQTEPRAPNGPAYGYRRRSYRLRAEPTGRGWFTLPHSPAAPQVTQPSFRGSRPVGFSRLFGGGAGPRVR